MTRSAEARLPFLAAAVGLVLTLVSFWPGYMSADSVSQLAQARSGDFDPWHPPLMAWVWSLTDRAVPGPGGMLILQNLMFWSGLAVIAVTTLPHRPRLAGVSVLAVGLAPPVFGLLSTVWKDVQMGAALVPATGLLLLAERRRSAAALALAPLLFVYAMAMRHNGQTAVIPLAVWWAWIVVGRVTTARPRVRAAAAVAAGVVLTGASAFVVSLAAQAVTGGKPDYPLQQCFVHDLVGISAVSGRDEVPAWEYEGTGAAPIGVQIERRRPEYVDDLFFRESAYPMVTDPGRVADLRAHWLDAVRRHPGTWLSNRWLLCRALFGFTEPHLTYFAGIDPNPFGIRHPHSWPNPLVMRLLRIADHLLLFRAWVWALVLVVLVAHGAATGRATAATWALAASAVAYAAPLFEAAPSDDFRYVWWSVLAAMLTPFTLARPPAGEAAGASS
jgi:hypothetical protein